MHTDETHFTLSFLVYSSDSRGARAFAPFSCVWSTEASQTESRSSTSSLFRFRRVLVGDDSPTTGWDVKRGTPTWSGCRFGIQNTDFFFFAFFLGLNDSNVLARSIECSPNLTFFFFRTQSGIFFQFLHQIVNGNPKRLFAGFDFTFQQGNVRLEIKREAEKERESVRKKRNIYSWSTGGVV